MSKRFDIAVIGAGVFGASAAHHLLEKGLRVVLVDAYGAGNARASSGGESRIIRMGYGADEIYTRWASYSLAYWRSFLSRAGRPDLFQPTGVLWMAREGDPYTTAALSTLKKVKINFEDLNRRDLIGRYPQIDFGDISRAIYEPESGALMARRAVQAIVETFIKSGGDYMTGSVEAPARGKRLKQVAMSDGGRVEAGAFVFACGPWLPKIFPHLLTDRIHVTRQEVFFFGPPAGSKWFAPPLLPTWIDFGAEMYGLPDLENRGFKIALDRHGEAFDPDQGERVYTQALLNEVRNFMERRFPAMKGAPLLESRVCQYENTSNGDFLIDRHPEFENVWLVGGGSGHGFKHGPAVGDYVSTLILDGGLTEERFSLATKRAVRERAVF